MKREPAWRRYLRFLGADPAADFEDELQFHLETKIEELIGAGCPVQQARAEALRRFGPVRPIRRECVRIVRGRNRQTSRAEYLAGWARDARHAARSLVRTAAASIAALMILAVGIGANTAVFTLLDRLILAPLPVPHPEQLRLFRQAATAPEFEALEAAGPVAAESILRVTERRGRERITHPAEGSAVSGNYFAVLQLHAQRGRVFTPGDRAPIAVLSDRFWARRFARSPDALGRIIYLNDAPYSIAGVLPRGFFGLHRGTDCDVYVPLSSLPAGAGNVVADHRWLRLFGRFGPGAAAPAESRDLTSGTPGTWGEQRRSLWLVAAVVAVLLLMGCANIACLLLARGTARQHEMAIRLSLGATRSRILRQAMLENGLLSFTGGALGLVLAFFVERLLIAAFQWQDMPLDLAPDIRVLAFGAALAVASGIIFGAVPAAQALGRAPRFRTGKVLAVVEIALSLVMVTGAAIFLRSFVNLRAVPTGFSPHNVTVIELGSADDAGDLRAPYRHAGILAASLRGAAGIDAVALADLLPFDDGRIDFQVSVPGEPPRSAHVLRIDASYFATLHIPLREGRGFTPADDPQSANVAILAEGTARRMFHGEDPLGRRIVVGMWTGKEMEIVGVAKDIKFSSVTAPAPDVVFQPLRQGERNTATTSTLKLHIRSRMRPEDVAALVRSRIREMDMPVIVESASPLEDAIGRSMLNDRVRMQASGAFAVVALLLITAGIYGLMAFSVTQRTREIGIRMAVGSRPAGIVAMVLRQALWLTVAGVIVGVPAAIAMMKAVSRLVFGLAPIDWPSVVLAALALLGTAILASAIPAWRAAHLDPVRALRVQ